MVPYFQTWPLIEDTSLSLCYKLRWYKIFWHRLNEYFKKVPLHNEWLLKWLYFFRVYKLIAYIIFQCCVEPISTISCSLSQYKSIDSWLSASFSCVGIFSDIGWVGPSSDILPASSVSTFNTGCLVSPSVFDDPPFSSVGPTELWGFSMASCPTVPMFDNIKLKTKLTPRMSLTSITSLSLALSFISSLMSISGSLKIHTYNCTWTWYL